MCSVQCAVCNVQFAYGGKESICMICTSQCSALLVASSGSAWTIGSFSPPHLPLVLPRELLNLSVWGLDRFIRLLSMLIGVYYTINWTLTPPWKGSSRLVNIRPVIALYTASVWMVWAAILTFTVNVNDLHWTKHYFGQNIDILQTIDILHNKPGFLLVSNFLKMYLIRYFF